MPTPKKSATKKTSAAKKSSGANGKQNRCWPGYEPVPGKAEHEQGSCRPQAKSKLTPAGKKVRSERKKEVDGFQASHPGSPRQSAQHQGSARTTRKAAKKTTSPKRAAAPRKATSRKRTATR